MQVLQKKLSLTEDNIDDMKHIILTLVMGFSFFSLFGQTNKFKTVDVNEFDRFISDSTVTLLRFSQKMDMR